MSKKKFLNKSLMYQYDKEIAAAFQVDCENFLNEFEKYQSFNYSDFVKVWHQQTFSHIFAGQTYALLLRDFCENAFYIIKKYIMFPRSLHTQIGALYLLYGVYYKQPLRGWVKIRVTLEEYQKVYELILEMKNRQQVDAVYIFSKMKNEEAFLYVAQRKPLGPEDRFVKDVEMYMNDTFVSTTTQSSFGKFESLKSNDLFTQLNETNTEYSELIKKYAEKCPQLAPFSTNIIADINAAYEKFQNWGQIPSCSQGKNNSNAANEETIIESRIAIKQRAMENKNAVYRGARSVKTASDLNEDQEDYESSDED